MNKKAFIDFDDISIVGIIFGIVGGLIAVLISQRMEAGTFWKIMSLAVTGVVCFFVGAKLSEG